MSLCKIAFVVDEAAMNSFESEYVLLPLLRNLLRENPQVEIFVCREGTLDDLRTRIDEAEMVFCYSFDGGNMADVVRYAEDTGKEILHLEPSKEDMARILEKERKKFNPCPGVYILD